MRTQSVLYIQPRYYRWHVDPGVEWVEPNTGYATLDWEIPVSQAALVLVDVWDRHYLKDTAARSERIVREKLCPLLRACRAGGLRVIHAPAPKLARECAAWVGAGAAGPERPACETPWPPSEFRADKGPYSKYAKPAEPREKERADRVAGLQIHPDALPQGDDVVIATGEELHRYCTAQKILFLFYAGFNTNACILLRDYGTVEMAKRGYKIVIVRDCTTGMESFETHDELWLTRGAVLFLEMFGKYSIGSEELNAAQK
ncbi:MAG: isochorismatase family protein [Kiritimatiellae bacterium]|nr:isochorismatase family protein [Kiritimatiellia bacterium]